MLQPLPRLCLKLVVITHIMTHSITLLEGTQTQVTTKLHSQPTKPYGVHTCPRWLNKQLKFLLSTLHRDLLEEILESIHKTLHDVSTKNSKKVWTRLFIGLLVLSMFSESIGM